MTKEELARYPLKAEDNDGFTPLYGSSGNVEITGQEYELLASALHRLEVGVIDDECTVDSSYKCSKCQGKGYREVTLEQLIKEPTPYEIGLEIMKGKSIEEAVRSYHDRIKSCLNLNLLK